MKSNPKIQNRVWELDALRGLLILCVLATHLYHTVDAFCIDGFYKIDSYAWVNATDPLHFWFDWDSDGKIYRAFLTDEVRNAWIKLGVDGFFVLSGICCMFSHNSLTRSLKMLFAALIVSVFTKCLAIWTGDQNQFIRFGVLHCYAYCQLAYHFIFSEKKNWVLLTSAICILIIGYYLRHNPVHSDWSVLYPFGIREKGAPGRDYWPIFPMLGWFLIGVVFGRCLYSKKKSLINYTPAIKITRPLQWIGRHSCQIYLAHIFIYTAVFCGIGWIFGLL